jgi:protocatechuate 3,4-dioxygenase beta subunit
MIHHRLSRRQLFGLALGAHALALGSRRLAWAQTLLKRTPDQILGPFYPTGTTPIQGTDLVALPGRAGRAQGQVIHVMGRVLNIHGQPLAGARVELWQANTHGRYTHPNDQNPAPLDPNFEGFGVQVADAEGRYHFKTIKPGSYPAGPTLVRPPHIHFEVIARHERLITQMYFAGEPLNDKDPFLQSVTGKDRLIVNLAPPTQGLEPNSLLAAWDIVMARG